MIRHAWSVLCNKSSIDHDTNNITLDVLEKITIGIQPLEQSTATPESLARPHVLPVNIEIVSLWFSTDLGERNIGRARIELVSPKQNVIGHTEMPLEFSGHNLRTRSRIAGFGSEGHGTYLFVVSAEDRANGAWHEVAAIPLHVEYKLDPGTEQGE